MTRHGYQSPETCRYQPELHRRGAFRSDDESCSSDYNTPDDLPTYIEGGLRHLTRRRNRGCAFFAPAASDPHRQAESPLRPRSASGTIAIRRSNPRNRWLLFTNLDMIFLPREGVADLTAAVRDLPDGLYILPRFELPSHCGKLFPAATGSHPGNVPPPRARAACGRITLALPANRFDQRAISARAAAGHVAIHGFEEA